MTDSGRTREDPEVDSEFRGWFDEHAPYVWGTLRRLGVPRQDREDALQEVFVTVHALMADFDRGRPFRPWVFAIAYRIALRYRRARGRRAEDLDQPSVEPHAETRSAEEQLLAAEESSLVQKALGAIELHRRAVFILKEIDGQHVPEIAEALGIPLNTAYSRLRLARADFRTAIAELRGGPS